MYVETLGFLTEHLKLYPLHKRVWSADEDEKNCGEVLEGHEICQRLAEPEVMAIHEFVLANYVATTTLYG